MAKPPPTATIASAPDALNAVLHVLDGGIGLDLVVELPGDAASSNLAVTLNIVPAKGGRANRRNLRRSGAKAHPGARKVHAEWQILAQKPRYPTGSAWGGKRARIERARDLVFLVEGGSSTRSSLPDRGFIRGIPRFLCQNSLFLVYFLAEVMRYLSISREYNYEQRAPILSPPPLQIVESSQRTAAFFPPSMNVK